MSEYLFIYRGSEKSATERMRSSPAEMQHNMQAWMGWMKKLAEKGHIKDNGHPLDVGGKIVRKGKAVTDGPYAEKDIVLGYTIVTARDADEAARLAEGCPILDGGGAVEVRPLIAM